MHLENLEESDVGSDSESEESYNEENSQSDSVSKKKLDQHKRKYEDIRTDAPNLKKKKTNSLYKPPTVEELNNLRETENLFNNNLFRLQIDELLNESKIKSKRKIFLSNWIENLKSLIENLPDTEITLSQLFDLKVKKKDKLLNKLVTFKNLFKTDQDITLSFAKPKDIQCFGLFEINCLPGPNLCLNINLSMPRNCFLVKDYLNNRYLVKRYYYLLYMGEYFKKCDLVSDLKISFYEDNNLLPIIELVPKGTDKTTVLIFVTPAEESFKCSRFLSHQNNCKIDIFDNNLNPEILKNIPTIFYNSLLAHDVTLYTNHEFFKCLFKDQPNVQAGIKLLCIWLKQRELNIGVGSFTENILLYLVAYLLYKKKINKFMSSYQIIRNFWNFLTSTDLLKEPIHIGETTQEILDGFKEHHSVVILDKTGCYNVASHLSAEIYKQIKLESQAALKYLDDGKNNSFHKLFLTSYPFHLQYDAVVDLTKSIPIENNNISQKEKCLYVGYNNLLIYNYIGKTLQKGLNKRAFNVVPRVKIDGDVLNSFLFGIYLNPDEAFNYLEKGPALNDFHNAASYREFWGHLATDRRFKDGSTNVAVYFKTNTIKAKRNIVKKVIQFVLEDKLKLNCIVHYNDFEDVLISKRLVPSYPNGTNEETCLKIILASNELGKKIRELNMSLKITGVQGVSDVFSYSEVFPPIPSNYQVDSDFSDIQGNSLTFSANGKPTSIPRYVQVIESVLHLEHSSKWPNNLEALRYIKTSFFLEMSKLLNSNHNLLTHVSREYLDVLFEGIVFRYRLFIPKEIGLLKKNETENGLTSFRDSDKSVNLEISLNILPKIMSALRGVQSLYPSYGPGTCLIKRWLRTQLIDNFHISDVVINLLNASLYLNSCSVPNTPQISFWRFLKFISEFDFNLQLVVVNFNDELTTDVISEVESKLQNNRNAYPNLFILTPYDQNLSIFTRNSPSKEILNRIKQLALESLNLINKFILDHKSFDVKQLFVPNFEGYNVLIHLKQKANSKRHEQIVFSSVDNRVVVEKYQFSEEDKIPIVDFDTVKQYLQSLRDNYGTYAIFFHDSYGGSVIGVLWHPKVFETSEFKANKINAGKIVNNKVVFNLDAVIEDFFILGKDLVKTIEKR